MDEHDDEDEDDSKLRILGLIDLPSDKRLPLSLVNKLGTFS